MGKIRKSKNQVQVEYNLDELITERAWIKFPSTPPPEGATGWLSYIGNMISRAAWRILQDKRPDILLKGKYNAVKVEGDGKVIITFYREDK